MWRGKQASAIGVGLLLARVAQAEEGGARALSVGQTGYANPGDVATLPLGLAATSLQSRYEVYSGVGFGADHRFLLRVGAVDSRTSALTLGAMYSRLTDNVPPTGAALPGWKPAGVTLEDPTEHDAVHLALAYPMLDRRLSVGWGGRYDWRISDLSGTDSAFNFGFSAAGQPVQSVTLAGGIYNLLENGYSDTERSFALGVRWDPGPYLGVEGAATAPLTEEGGWDAVEWHIGASVGIAEAWHLNGGFFNDGALSYATGGLAIVTPKADLDYGMKIAIQEPARNIHEIDVRIRF